MSVCMPFTYLKNHTPKFHKKFSVHVIAVAAARSSSDDAAKSYVLPVLWMTSCFHITHVI